MSRKNKHRTIQSKSSTSLSPVTQSKAIRGDGWSNVLTNLGSQNSRINTTTYAFVPKIDRQTLTNIYTNDAIARQVVNIIVDDAMRGFINADQLLLDELKRLGAKQKITDGATWGRLYGGAALIAFADDGQEMEKPLNLERLRKVVSIQAYDRWQLNYMPTDVNQDFYSEHYGQPEVYTIAPNNGTPFRVHRTRMHFFAGERIPSQQLYTNQGWDDSILQSLYEPLRNFGQTMNALAEITQDYIQKVIGVDGLVELITGGGEDEIVKRMNINDLTSSVANTIFLDSQHETYTKHSSNVGGLADITEKHQEVLCAGSRITMTRLFGNTTKGLGSSGQNDPDNMNNTVEAYRCDQIEPCIDWLIPIVEAQSMWVDKPESFDWTFPPLKVSNEHEVAKNRLMAAQMDQVYMNAGADPKLLFSKRYSPSGFQTDIFISEEELEEMEGKDEVTNYNEQDLQRSVSEVKSELAKEAKLLSNQDSDDEEKKTQKLLDHELTKTLIKTLGEINNEQ